jgi:hypothetical protein
MRPAEIEDRFLSRLKAANLLDRCPALAAELERRESERRNNKQIEREFNGCQEALLAAERAAAPAVVTLLAVPSGNDDVVVFSNQARALLAELHSDGRVTKYYLPGGHGFTDAATANAIRAKLADGPRHESEPFHFTAVGPFTDLRGTIERAVGADNRPRMEIVWLTVLESLPRKALPLLAQWFDSETDDSRKLTMRGYADRLGFNLLSPNDRAQVAGRAA